MAIIGLTFVFGSYQTQPQINASAAPIKVNASAAPIKVNVSKLVKLRHPIYFELLGRVTPFEVSQIRPQVTGIIQEKTFVEGSNVVQNQQLYQIEPAPFIAAFNHAKANLVKAKAIYDTVKMRKDRFYTLLKKKSISVQKYEDVLLELAEAEAQILVEQAKVEEAEINLNYTKVLAPISGYIGKSNVTKGALVTTNQDEALAQITSLDPIYVDINQPIQNIDRKIDFLAKLKNQTITLHFDSSINSYPLPGILKFADIVIDEDTNSILLRAEFANPNKVLLPGLFVKVKLLEKFVIGYKIPQHTLQRNPEGSPFIYIADQNSTIQIIDVDIMSQLDNHYVITGKIPKDAFLLLDNLVRVQLGNKVETHLNTAIGGQ
tara:strand:+ start:1777 stop:2904 length:1128 start_codon:yes stop_codon:yes gene_type:complete